MVSKWCRVTADEVEVLLGEHNYTNPDESDEIRVAVKEITIHPQVKFISTLIFDPSSYKN